MRRPHRSIETFDISLMAVVTKAMGAFLVMMLLLMPYYSSGPIGQQTAADLAQKVSQVEQKIKDVVDKINVAAPEDLRKLLEEVLLLLDDAQRLIAELRRANDALQAQAKRLEEQVATLNTQVNRLEEQVATLNAQVVELQNENDSLRAQVAPLQQKVAELQAELDKLKGNRVTASLFSPDCKSQLRLELYHRTSFVIFEDKSKSNYILNFSGMGDSISGTKPAPDKAAAADPLALPSPAPEPPSPVSATPSAVTSAAKLANPMFSTVVAGGLKGGNDLFLVAKNIGANPKIKNAKGVKSFPLFNDADCTFILTLFAEPKLGKLRSIVPQEFSIKKGTYALMVRSFEVTDDNFVVKPGTGAPLEWLVDQVAHADKGGQ